MTRAQSLKQETALNSITPERAGGIMYDTAALLNQQQLQGTNPLLISKIYASIEAMEADDNPVSDITGEALKPGQIVVISSAQPDEPDEGLVYRFNGIVEEVSSWTCVGKIGSSPYLEGYQYMGKAVLTPTPTDPGVPTQKVFYQATEPGTYTNFAGIVVADGEVVNLKWDGTAWSKEVTGAATASVVDALRAATEIHDFQPIANTAIQTGKRFDANGDIQDSTRLSIYNFPVVGGNTYAFSGRYTSIVTSVYFLAWYDEDGNFISKESYKSSVAADPYTVQITRQIVTAPAGAVTAKMNVQTSPSQVQYMEFLDAPALNCQESFDMAVKTRDVVDSLSSTSTSRPLSANRGRDLNDKIVLLDGLLRQKTVTLLVPDTILENTRSYQGEIQSSETMDLYVFNNIDPSKRYTFSGKYASTVSAMLYYIGYYDSNDAFISYDIYHGPGGSPAVKYVDAPLAVPENAAKIKMNVSRTYRSSFDLKSVVFGDYYPIEEAFNRPDPLRVVVNADKSFRVRFSLADNLDGILTFGYYQAYGYVRNCIMMDRFYTGSPDETDAEILAKTDYQNCRDSQSPMFTANFGPMFSNHGYSTPRVNAPGHGLTDADLGSEWIDQSDYHYTLGHIDGNWLYLLPVINSTGVPGHETRDWKWYASPYPTEITRNVAGGETIAITSSARWDYQVSALQDVRVLINGVSVGAGEYGCSEVELSYRQIGYNPIEVSAWWPSPVYGGVMMTFDRHFTLSGAKGFLSLTSNTVVNNKYPFPLYHYIDVVPQFPFQQGNFVPYIYIPKLKKVTADIDFREEFASPDGSHATVPYLRNATDLVDVDDMPDRAYCYLKDDLGAVLFGCAGGHSLVRGMSAKAVRNNYIDMGHQVGTWNPAAGNKHYNNILLDTGEEGNMVTPSFINEFEGYMCWYVPRDGIHVFYHRSKDGYVVYIHTSVGAEKAPAKLPDWMNNLGVFEVVEKTEGIELLTNTVIDGCLYFSSDTTDQQYNYIVVRVK